MTLTEIKVLQAMCDGWNQRTLYTFHMSWKWQKKLYIFKNNWNKKEDIKLSAHDGFLKICYCKLLDRFIAKYIAADLWKKNCDGQQFYKYYQHK